MSSLQKLGMMSTACIAFEAVTKKHSSDNAIGCYNLRTGDFAIPEDPSFSVDLRKLLLTIIDLDPE